MGDWAIAASQLEQLAQFAYDERRIDEALSMLAEALLIKRELDMPELIVESLCRFAYMLAMAGRAQVAAVLLAADQELREAIGGGFAWVAANNSETLAKLRTQLDEATLEEAFAQGRKLRPDEAVAIALDAAE